jgi:predicted Rossmann fold flavoprotein
VTYDVIVIGGGASGMFAACRAAEGGARALLVERNRRLGIKLGLTGNGRCNLTNTDSPDDFIASFGRNGKFLRNAIARFSNVDLAVYFRRLGVATREEEGGRIFPARGGSARVIDALERQLRDRGVTIRLGARVERIVADDAGGAVRGVAVRGERPVIEAPNVILATGGMSYPATGSTGDGYSMAGRLGHTIVGPRPALVPLETLEPFPKRLAGVSLADVRATVLANGRRAVSREGDLLFTHFGLSGPVVLSVSGLVVERLDRGERVVVSIALPPEPDRTSLEGLLAAELSRAGKRTALTVVKRLVPRALAPVLLTLAGVDERTEGSQLTAAERGRLAAVLGDFRLTVTRPRPIEEAIVTRGGVDVGEIDPRTMESRKVRGLFFCGEVIDVDGDSGGYNLQAAFSTAFVSATKLRPASASH